MIRTKESTLAYEVKNLKHRYGKRQILDVDALDIKQGEIFALVGPSGAGKSTLLRLLGFLENPTNGEIYFNGRLCDNEWPDLESRRRLTVVFQRPLLLRRSVYDNVAYGLGLRGRKNGDAAISDALAQLGLAELSKASAHTLSGGELQRVALARALVLDPDVLLLDEPTANLDPYNINLIESIVAEANEKFGTTVIVVTHNVFQARRLAHRVVLMMNGELVEVAQTEDFFERPQHPETAAFVKGEIVY